MTVTRAVSDARSKLAPADAKAFSCRWPAPAPAVERRSHHSPTGVGGGCPPAAKCTVFLFVKV